MVPKSKRWSISKRLEFIEFRLFWQGQINRSDLIEKFKISVPQASNDLSEYEATCPGNMQYDSRLRGYVPSVSFHPKFYNPSARRYLSDLRAINDGSLELGSTWLGTIPDHAHVPVLRRRLKAEKLQRVLNAIRQNLALKIRYQSFTEDDPTDRWITPHALASDGVRWHIRAWCHRRSEFRDFLFVRIRSFLGEVLHETVSDKDILWHEQLTAALVPNPKLPLGQRQVLEADYGMKKGRLETTMRACLFYYFEKNLLLDKEAENLPDERRQLVLTNRQEITADYKRLNEAAILLNATISPMKASADRSFEPPENRVSD